ncbi:Retrovirus-related Pol polyprotein from transposon TNT 1-94 [Gossypium australe]|uniref:Retrovirus-related Pol polyprotein from transposon TNT 1-94 n=1 Tax=Gossypium australe TaxID=47621 RepID=A0A5B6W8D0_9ROSI|nr:Retrovirus-related Pol polyprotein from transposon TNT 1-94 [Gossypium australe]
MTQLYPIPSLSHTVWEAFLRIEVTRSRKAKFVSQRKYVLDLLKETGMIGYKPASTLMDSKKKLRREEKGVPIDKGRYQCLVGKLIYLSHTQTLVL